MPAKSSTDTPRPSGRPAAIRPARESKVPRVDASKDIGTNERLASHNSSEYEFDEVRKDIEELVTRSMCAAEAGVRLQVLLRRHPDLLADQSRGMSSRLEGGGSGTVNAGLSPSAVCSIIVLGMSRGGGCTGGGGFPIPRRPGGDPIGGHEELHRNIFHR